MYKRLLAIGVLFLGIGTLLIAIVVLNGYNISAQTAGGSTTATATMGAHIWIEVPTSFAWDIEPDSSLESDPQDINVKTNKEQAWDVKASLGNSGKLLFGAISLEKTLSIIAGSVETPGPLADTVIYTATAPYRTGGTPTPIPTKFKQEATFEDVPGAYTGTITITAGYKP